MKKFIKYTLFLAIFALSLFGLERLIHQATGGFTIVNITDPHPFDPRWEVDKPAPQDFAQIKRLLDQPYRYLSPGGQSYAFVSEDDQYVLKITKYKHMRIAPVLNMLPTPGFLKEYKKKKLAKKKLLFDRTFQSYIISYKYLKDHTGLVYMHLNKTPGLINQTLSIIDNIGIEHKLDIDDMVFILQKRAILTYPYIDQLVLDNNMDKAKLSIRNLLLYLYNRCKLGLEDHDLCFGTNLGFLYDKPFQIDIGSMRFNPSFTTDLVAKNKLRESSIELKEWLQNNHPSLYVYYLDLIEDLSS